MSDKNSEEKAEEEEDTKFDLSAVIDSFIHRVLDIEDCATEFVQLASKNYNANAERLKVEIEECNNLLTKEADKNSKIVGMRRFRKFIREVDRHNNSKPTDVLEKSLFISLFASFDKFIGDLVAVLYDRNPELYKGIHREVPLSETILYESLEELRQSVLDKEIESIRRKGYIEQFDDLEKRFSIKLTKFETWPVFIERAQRRNLFTHCDGVVSKQYLEVCKSVGVKFEEIPEVGDQLEIGAGYFFQSCRLITEVAVMLAQTLWRKIDPGDIEKADGNLNSIIFDFLHTEAWGKAITLSKFALGLPKISDEQMERLFTVNYGIALNAIDKNGAAKNVLDKKDWSATSYDFKIAFEILSENYEEAANLMLKLGKEGALISEMAYHDWPLFRNFRESPEFFGSYQKVYGYKYSEKLHELAGEKKLELDERVEEDCAE